MDKFLASPSFENCMRRNSYFFLPFYYLMFRFPKNDSFNDITITTRKKYILKTDNDDKILVKVIISRLPSKK